MTDFSALRRLGDKVKPAGEGMHWRTGVIVTYAAGRATVNVGGDTTDIPDLPCFYAASPGDNVLILSDGAIQAVIGQLT